jgi:hypothetical protein
VTAHTPPVRLIGVTAGTVTLDGPAPPGGTPVALETRPPGVINVPSSVIVPGGEDHVSFDLDVAAVDSDADVTLTASLGAIAHSTSIQVAAARSALHASAESTSLAVQPPPVGVLAALIDSSATPTTQITEITAQPIAIRKLLRPTHAERSRRHYLYSSLPVLVTESLDLTDQDKLTVLLATYTEVTASWRMLTDVRFKLLGLVPLASVVILGSLFKVDSTGASGLASLGGNPLVWLLAGVGLIATIGLWVYDRRNSQLYDDLISRGRRIEAELGLDTGQFLGRKEPSRAWLNHTTATSLVYLGSIGAWLVALIWFTLQARR